jgi:peroxiredoxin
MQCRQHAVQLGRIYTELQLLGAEVLVIGSGSREDAERVANQLKLPFPMLADPDRAVYLCYGLDKVFRAIQRSGTFLIDPQGTVRWIEQGALPQMLNKGELMREIQKLQGAPV